MDIINLHFFVDEKVVSRCIKNFEDVLPHQNRYIIVIPDRDYQLKHVKVQNEQIFAVTYGSEEFYKAVGDLRQYRHVIIHLLTWEMFQFASEHPEGHFTWVTWGSDLYSDLLEVRGYKLYYDKKAIYKYQGRNKWYKRLGRATLGKFYEYKRMRVKVKALKNISRICTTPGDYRLLMEYFPEAQHLERARLGGYYPLDAMISKSLLESRVVGQNIIVGNSAYGHGNHVEVFQKLRSIDLTGRKVIVPLSYGDMPEYIMEEGKRILGEHFEPIVDFMPLDEYNKLLLSSSVFIYGNYRQAAVGNIVVALYVGGKVFLDEKNPLLQMYRDSGCIIFSIDELPEKINYELTEEEIETNKNAVIKNNSYEYLVKNIKQYFS